MAVGALVFWMLEHLAVTLTHMAGLLMLLVEQLAQNIMHDMTPRTMGVATNGTGFEPSLDPPLAVTHRAELLALDWDFQFRARVHVQ